MDPPEDLKSIHRPGGLWHRLSAWLPTLSETEQATVYRTMRHNALASVDFYVLITLATTIAYFGLMQNSAAVIIGAMLVAPLMSPIVAVAHSIVMGNIRMARQGLLSTLTGVALAIGITAMLTLLLPGFPPRSEILSRTQPTLLDLLVALASGAAAGYALARKEVAAALPGVAIAAALVPPLSVVGYGIGSSRWDLAMSAGLLFLTNLASIVLAAALMFLLLGFRPTHDDRSQLVRRGLRYALLGIVLISVPLALSSVSIARTTQRESAVRTILAESLDPAMVEIEDVQIERDQTGYTIIAKAYVHQDANDQMILADIYQKLSTATGAPVTLRIQVLAAALVEVDERGIHLVPGPQTFSPAVRRLNP